MLAQDGREYPASRFGGFTSRSVWTLVLIRMMSKTKFFALLGLELGPLDRPYRSHSLFRIRYGDFPKSGRYFGKTKGDKNLYNWERTFNMKSFGINFYRFVTIVY
jgi:hypothetical protein